MSLAWFARGRECLAGLFTLCLVTAVFAAESEVQGTQGAVLEHHGNAGRSGMFVLPSLTFERAHNLHRDPSFRADVEGPIYAQPLYWRVPGSAQALLVVASEQNQVYALDAASGTVVWKTSLGPPVPRSALPCGNIDPLGITGAGSSASRSRSRMPCARGRPARAEVASGLRAGSSPMGAVSTPSPATRSARGRGPTARR